MVADNNAIFFLVNSYTYLEFIGLASLSLSPGIARLTSSYTHPNRAQKLRTHVSHVYYAYTCARSRYRNATLSID